MSLKEQLLQDMKLSMKEKDTLRKDVIQIIRAGILQIEKDEKITLDDNGIMDVIAKELKKRRDVLPDYQRSGRQDLVDDLERQISILINYLPQQLSEAELEKIVQSVIQSLNASSMKDMGRVMQAVKEQVKGSADNKLISQLVKKNLQV